MSLGSVAIVLHAHLPWVHHPEYPNFLEEDWLYEAMLETYLPILGMLDGLERDGIETHLTMSLTPPLCEMLACPGLRARFEQRLDALIELAAGQVLELAATPFADAAKAAHTHLRMCHTLWHERAGGDLIGAFRQHQRRGALVIITCGATHGLLPFITTVEGRRAQIAVARDNYLKHFGQPPRGIWLGECAWQRGVDRLLKEAGIDITFVETHGVTWAEPRPRFGHYRPILSPNGVFAFGRDPECSRQVWSSEQGYPGDSLYREFYRDLGWELDETSLRPLIGDGPRRNIGLKLHRVTGKVALGAKEPYIPDMAAEKAREHARHFVQQRILQLQSIGAAMDTEPLLVAPYDAELFGHWWFEGPLFLDAVFREAHRQRDVIRLTTPVDWLERHPVAQLAEPCPSSWGDGGYWDVWANGQNSWIYSYLQRAEERFVDLATQMNAPTVVEERALKQAARELLLAQSSDWAFIITMATTVPYAVKRTRTHIHRLERLCQAIETGTVDAALVAEFEGLSPVFAEIDWRHWQRHGRREAVAGVSVAAFD
jgi:1,4-alpha-glucan branching enzyme